MAYLDPHLMNTFRGRIRNPRYWQRLYGAMKPYCRGCNLRDPREAYGMVDRLSVAMDHPLTPEQRDNAACWLMECGVDPGNPAHRARMKALAFGGGWL